MSHPFVSLLSLAHSIVDVKNDRDVIAFILRNTPGATVDVDNIRTVQAAMAWWKKFGGEASFEAYLEQIPAAPDYVALQKEFPQLDLPTLVDARLDLAESAFLAGIGLKKSPYSNIQMVPFNPERAISSKTPYWVLAHDGTPNRCRRQSVCRDECVGRLLPGTAEVLTAIWLQHGARTHIMVGPGSLPCPGSNYCAQVDLEHGVALLSAGRDDGIFPGCGSVVFVQG